MVGDFAREDVRTEEVENHFASRPQLAHELARAWMMELKELIAMAAEDDRPEPLQEYVARGRSWKFMAVIEHAVRRGATADGEGEGGAAGGVFGNEIVDMLIGLYQVCLIDDYTKYSPWPPANGANRVARVPLVLSPCPSETLAGFTQLLSSGLASKQQAQKNLVNAGDGHDKRGNRNLLRELQHRGSPALPDTFFRGRRPLAASQGDVQDAEEGDLEGADAAAEEEETGKPEVCLFCDGANWRVSRLPQNLLDVGGAAEQPGMESDFEKAIDLRKCRVGARSCYQQISIISLSMAFTRLRSKAAFEETNSSDGTELGIAAREIAAEHAAALLPPCPMDFQYFDSVVRSDDEAKYMAKWRKAERKRGMEDANEVRCVVACFFLNASHFGECFRWIQTLRNRQRMSPLHPRRPISPTVTRTSWPSR